VLGAVIVITHGQRGEVMPAANRTTSRNKRSAECLLLSIRAVLPIGHAALPNVHEDERGHAVTQLVEALRCKPEGRGLYS